MHGYLKWSSPFIPKNTNYIILESTDDDFIGEGNSYLYTENDAVIKAYFNIGHFNIEIEGDENWSGDFQLPDNYNKLEAGYYPNLKRYPFHNSRNGGLNWSGKGNGCNQLSGWFAIDDCIYIGTSLYTIKLRFEQQCIGREGRLNGTIYWNSSNEFINSSTLIIPNSLWKPKDEIISKAGSFVYLERKYDYYKREHWSHLYNETNSVIKVFSKNGLIIIINNNDHLGEFQLPDIYNRIEPGYYPNLMRNSFHNPRKGGLQWGSGCNKLNGWLAIDNCTYNGTSLDNISFRFEKHCEEDNFALHGMVKWNKLKYKN